MDEPKRVEIVVVKTPSGYLVRPAYARAKPGDTLVFSNYTALAIEVMLPKRTAFGVFTASGDSGEGSAPVSGDAANGFYPYAVYSHEAKDFCVGKSSPGVIIGR